mgnify:FL=1
MKKRLLLTFVMMATWMVVGCTTNFTNTDGRGCYGYWESNYWGLKRGTLLKNQNYSKPYRQCVDEDNIILNKEKRPYG